MKTVGVLALQGGFDAHARALREAGAAARLVRVAADLAGLDGLVLPGGESGVMLRLLGRHGLEGPLRELHARRVPILATCAGLILAARAVRPEQPSLGWLDVTVTRNAWGRQLDSFEATDDAGQRKLVFIRAPRIVGVGPRVEVLAKLKGEPVLVKQGSVVGATYHPELVGHELHGEIFGA
jgi:pyridoxal 5'-phosphate synthase pdxT subunit